METIYFDSMFDDFGVWQHTDGNKPIAKEGYALDDATRGLLLCLSLGKMYKANVLFDYIVSSKNGDKIYGFATDKREFIPNSASEDAVGQIVWAFGYCVNVGFRSKEARDFITSIIPILQKMTSFRGPVYALLGALYVDKKLSNDLYRNITKRFENLDESWLWPEITITYGNGIVPYALLRYALLNKDKKAEKLGRDVLEFLEKVCTTNRVRGPIGNDGWYTKGDKLPAIYSQQPIDAAYMVWAWMCAFQLSNSPADLKNAKLWMQWFDGKNIADCPMYDKDTLKAYDGINPINADHSNEKGINHHSGAETNICFLLSRWMLKAKQTI